MKILVEPLIDDKSHGYMLQGKKFNLSLRFTNLDAKPSSPFLVENLNLKSASGHNIVDDCDFKTYNIDVINPEEFKVLQIGVHRFQGHGLMIVEFTIKPHDLGQEIQFAQKDHPIGRTSFLRTKNKWNDFIWVESLSENNQKTSNRLTLRLNAFLTFLAILQVYKLFEIEFKSLINKITEIDPNIVVIFVATIVASTEIINKILKYIRKYIADHTNKIGR